MSRDNWCIPAVSDQTVDAIAAACVIAAAIQDTPATASYVNWALLRDRLQRANNEVARARMYAAMVELPFDPGRTQ